MTGTDRASRAKHALSTVAYMQEKAAKIKKGGEGCTEEILPYISCCSVLACSADIKKVCVIMCLPHRYQSAQAECESTLIHLQHLPHSLPLHHKRTDAARSCGGEA